MLSVTPPWRSQPGCLDYQRFTRPLNPALDIDSRYRLLHSLAALGNIGPERLGVNYLHSSWGFLVVPPSGYPELKASFPHSVEDSLVQRILSRINNVITTI